jgi:hypothetical protein
MNLNSQLKVNIKMPTKNTHSPVFPVDEYIGLGLTKREMFSIQILQGFLSAGQCAELSTTRRAVELADDLLQSLEY